MYDIIKYYYVIMEQHKYREEDTNIESIYFNCIWGFRPPLSLTLSSPCKLLEPSTHTLQSI